MSKKDGKPIGEMLVDVKAGETVAVLDLRSGKMFSNKIKFRPWGKQKLLRLVRLC